MIKELLKSPSGALGLAILAAFVAVSVYVVVTYPLDYGTRYWSNPQHWAEYPRQVPPEWFQALTPYRLPPQHVQELTSPSESGAVKRWRFTYRFDYDVFPTGILLEYSGLTFHQYVPVVSLAVVRPDGSSVQLLPYDGDISPPRPGERPPYVRFANGSRLILLSGDPNAARVLAGFLATRGVNCSADDIVRQNLATAIVFGQPTSSACGPFAPLKGDYVFELTLAGDPRDSIGSVRLVIQGAVYGAMGTDYLGRDLGQGLLFGFPVALFIGGVVSVLATAVGVALGILSGYIGGRVDEAIQRVADVMNNLPLLPLLILFVFVLGPRLSNVILVLTLFGWPGITVVVRPLVLSIRDSPFVESARLAGASRWWIMRRHILPQVLPYSLALLIIGVPGAILSEASLSILGLGDPSIPTWGQILQSALDHAALQNYAWWWTLPPGILIVLTSLGFVLVFFAVEPLVNPRLRRQ